MSVIHVSNTADHSAAQQIRAHEQTLHIAQFPRMVCQQTQYIAFHHLIRHTARRRNYAVVDDPIRRSSSVTFCYKGRKFAFADTHHYAQAEISKTPLTQFTRGIRGSMIGR